MVQGARQREAVAGNISQRGVPSMRVGSNAPLGSTTTGTATTMTGHAGAGWWKRAVHRDGWACEHGGSAGTGKSLQQEMMIPTDGLSPGRWCRQNRTGGPAHGLGTIPADRERELRSLFSGCPGQPARVPQHSASVRGGFSQIPLNSSGKMFPAQWVHRWCSPIRVLSRRLP